MDWLGIVGLATGIIFFVIGTALTVRYGRTSPQLRFRLKVWEVIGALTGRSPGTDVRDSRLQIRYDNQPVEIVSKLYVAFWNSRGTLRGDDARTNVPCQLTLPKGCIVLGAPQVRARTSAANQFRAVTNNDDPSCVDLTFDYLNDGDGALVEVLISGDAKGATIIGEFRGARRPSDEGALDLRQREEFRALFIKRLRTFDSVWLGIGALFVLVFAGATVVAVFVDLFRGEIGQAGLNLLGGLLVVALIGAAAVALVALTSWFLVIDYSWVSPKRRILPKELRFFPRTDAEASDVEEPPDNSISSA